MFSEKSCKHPSEESFYYIMDESDIVIEIRSDIEQTFKHSSTINIDTTWEDFQKQVLLLKIKNISIMKSKIQFSNFKVSNLHSSLTLDF